MTSRGPVAESGSATVRALTIAVLLVIVAVAAVQIVLVIGLRQRAAAAADLAALAASRASVEGADPCGAAARVAQRNGARLRDCRMDADVATVRVRAVTTHWLIGDPEGRWGTEQRARAAPAWYLR